MTDAQEFVETNRKFWDKQAATYSSKPWQIKFQQRIIDGLRENVDFIGIPPTHHEGKRLSGQNIKLLDYACGTGSVTRALAPYVTTSIGVDISESMVHKFNDSFSPDADPDTKPPCQGYAFVGDLLAETPSNDLKRYDMRDIDIAAIGLGFHHFADPGMAIERLVHRVKPGSGIVLIIDWLPDYGDDGHGNAHAHGEHSQSYIHQLRDLNPEAAKTVKTHGFTVEDMRAHFEAAGCTDFRFMTLPEPLEMWMGEGDNAKRRLKTIFFARGQRGA